MMAVRVGAAMGEAGCFPPAYSFVGDYFDEGERPKAYTLFMSGISVSIVASLLLGGWINQMYGWRVAFLVIGIPGVFLSLMAKYFLPEPRAVRLPKSSKNADSTLPNNTPPVMSALKQLWALAVFRNIVIALSLVNFVGLGLGQWLAVYFVREFSIATGELGIWLGLYGGVAGIVGTLVGGRLLGRLCKNDVAILLKIVAGGVALLAPVYWLILMLPNQWHSLMMLGPLNVLFFFFYGPVMSLIHSQVPQTMTAFAVAFLLFTVNLIGMGLGPQAVGILSDVLREGGNTVQSLRLAMLSGALVSLLSSYFFWRAARSVKG